MKLFKNKKSKALVAAVTMSLVMGVCGNALARDERYGDERTIDNVTISRDQYIGLGYDYVYSNNLFLRNHATVNANIAGGVGNYLSENNFVSVENSTVNGSVFGGICRNNDAHANVVELSQSTVNKGNVVGGQAEGDGSKAYDNIVNVKNFVTVQNTVYGGVGSVLENNTLNVQGAFNQFGGIAGFQNINFDVYGNKELPLVPINLTVKDAIDLSKISSINAVIKEYDPGATITLLSSPNSDFTKLSKSKLKINGGAGDDINVDKSLMYDGDPKNIDAISAVAGFDISKNELKFVTKYKLNNDLNFVNRAVHLNNELQLNGQTINMHQLTDATANDLLTVKKLTGKGNLAIDVDFGATLIDGTKTILTDYINSDEANDAVINLSNVFVKRDLPGTLTGLQEEKGEISVIRGNVNGITLKADSVKAATPNYIYVFTPGEAGKLNFTKMLPGTIDQFIQHEGKFVGANTFTQITHEVAERDLGTTYRENGKKDITLVFNKGITLSGDKKKYEGVTVADGYTFKLKGDKTDPGKLTQFKTAAVTVNAGGTLEVANMKFEGNDEDIINNGTLSLQGDNTIKSVIGTGTTNIEAGSSKISDRFEQSDVNVKSGATLGLSKNAKITGTINNNGTINLYGSDTLGSVRGAGRMNVSTVAVYGETTVNGDLQQNYVYVEHGEMLILNGSENNIDTLHVWLGSAKLNENSINKIGRVINWRGTVYLNGSNTIGSMTGDPFAVEPNFRTVIEGGETTVTGYFRTTTLDVDAGKLTLQGTSDGINKLNIKSSGVLEVANTLIIDNGNGVNNDGTVIMNSSKDNTLNSVTGNGTFNVEQGKTTVSGAFNQKEVNVNANGTLKLTGGQNSFVAGTTQGHTVNVKGGNIASYIYGGCSKGDAYENTVNINKATVQGEGTIKGDVYGGCTAGNAFKNIVNIDGSTVHGDVYGGLTFKNGTAYENTVNIVNSTINGHVYGGINEKGDNNRHYGNVVNLTGSTVGGFVYGASDLVESNNLLRVNGSNSSAVKAGNIAYFQKLEFNLPEGYNRNNALLTLGYNEATSESAIIAQDTSLNLNGLNEESAIVVKSSSPKDVLKKGDQVTLIHKNEGSLEIKNNGQNIFNQGGIMNTNGKNMAVYMASLTYILRGKLQLDEANNNLIFVAGSHASEKEVEDLPEPDAQPEMARMLYAARNAEPGTEPNLSPDLQPGDLTGVPDPGPVPGPRQTGIPDIDTLRNELLDNIKTAMETRANAAALLNEGSDFLMGQGLSNAVTAAKESKAEGNSSMAPFAALGGGKLRYETGSHVDSKSWHGAVGVAKEVNGLTFGVAVQQGKSKYDAYVNKAHSEGNSKSVGGALFAEKKTSDGLHFETALRAGRIKNNYNAQLEYTGIGVFDMHYKESSAFCGLSLGGGKEFTLKNKDKVDVYGRYSWTHTGGSDVTTEYGDELNFNAIDSHRIMLGGRYTHAVNERNEVYAGLGWQYELGGKVKGTTTSCGYAIRNPEPSLKGSSGMLELGWKVAAEENFTVDFNVNGWTGKQRGVMGGVNMQWKF